MVAKLFMRIAFTRLWKAFVVGLLLHRAAGDTWTKLGARMENHQIFTLHPANLAELWPNSVEPQTSSPGFRHEVFFSPDSEKPHMSCSHNHAEAIEQLPS